MAEADGVIDILVSGKVAVFVANWCSHPGNAGLMLAQGLGRQ